MYCRTFPSFSPSATPFLCRHRFAVVKYEPFFAIAVVHLAAANGRSKEKSGRCLLRFALVRRHHLRWLALSFVELAPRHHLSSLHLPPSRRKRKTEDGSTSLKWTRTATKGPSAASTPPTKGRLRANDANGSFARANAANGSFAHSNADKDPCVWLSPINRTF
jgi:hypothetical protein